MRPSSLIVCSTHWSIVLCSPIPFFGLHMEPNEYTVVAKNRLGVYFYRAEKKCPFCKAGVNDIYGDLANACHGREDAIGKHERVRDKIVSPCSSALLSPVVEKRTSFPKINHCFSYVLVPAWEAAKPAAFDVTVTWSLQSNSLTNAATKNGHALDAADERKYCLHNDICAKMGFSFVPLAIEVLVKTQSIVKKHSNVWLCEVTIVNSL